MAAAEVRNAHHRTGQPGFLGGAGHHMAFHRIADVGRRFRLQDGTSVILGRDANENRQLAARRAPSDTLVAPVSVPGPTALLPRVASETDLDVATRLVCAWSRFDSFPGDITVKVVADATTTERTIPRPYDRAPFLPFQLT